MGNSKNNPANRQAKSVPTGPVDNTRHPVIVPAPLMSVVHICRPTGTAPDKSPTRVIDLSRTGVTTCDDCGGSYVRAHN